MPRLAVFKAWAPWKIASEDSLINAKQFGIKAPVPDRSVVSFGDRESACLNPISGRPSVPPENCIDTEAEGSVGTANGFIPIGLD